MELSATSVCNALVTRVALLAQGWYSVSGVGGGGRVFIRTVWLYMVTSDAISTLSGTGVLRL